MGLTIVVNGKTTDGDIQNVLSFQGSGAILANAQEIVDELVDIWVAFMRPFQSVNYQFDDMTVYDSASVAGTPGLVIVPTLGTIIGTEAASDLPYGVALLVAYTSSAGPPHRGRTYFGGLTEASNGNRGLFDGTTVTNFAAGCDAMKDIVLADASIVQLAIKSRGTLTVPANTLARVTGVTGRSNPAYQRRRRLGVGS